MPQRERQDVSLASFFSTVVAWRRRILINFVVLTVISLTIALLLPLWYTSSATLLPPEVESQSPLGMFSLMANLPFNLENIAGLGGSPSDLYIAILRSRTVREQVIKKLGLMSVWEEDSMEDALRMLDGLTDIDRTEEGLIVISTTARSRELAKSMAETFVEELDRVNRNIRFSTARQTREFIEKRFEQAENDLYEAAEALKNFQNKYGVISLEDQTRAAIETAAEIRARIMLKEVEYEVLKGQLSESHEKIKILKANIRALEDQLRSVENGADLSDGVFIPFSNLPELGMRFAFLLKDLEVQKKIYELLAQQLEQARIREMRDTPTVQLLDSPALPERKSKPKRAYIVIAAWILSFFVSGAQITVRGYIERLRTASPDDYGRLVDAYESLRTDLKRITPWKRSEIDS